MVTILQEYGVSYFLSHDVAKTGWNTTCQKLLIIICKESLLVGYWIVKKLPWEQVC